jgi:tRNA nucleotidyltransferase (CCA-adding enzyme)
VIKTLEQLDAFRKPERFEKFLLASEADARGRPGYENRTFPQGDFFRQALIVSKDVDISGLRALGFENMALANKIKENRISAVTELKEKFSE